MRIAVIGSGNIGGTLSGRLVAGGQEVTVGVRAGGARDGLDERIAVASIPEALSGAEAVIVAIPGGRCPRSRASTARRLRASS